MKLSTYNFLTSKAIKGVKVGFPLKLTVSTNIPLKTKFLIKYTFLLQIAKKDVVETEFNPTFIERLLPKLDWPTVHLAAQMVSSLKVFRFNMPYFRNCCYFLPLP